LAAWDNARVSAFDPDLHHVLLVGGTEAEWSCTGDGEWETRLAALGAAAERAGARWLTLRPFGSSQPADAVQRPPRRHVVGRCTVTADPIADGRARFVAAVEALRAAGRPIDEQSIDAALNEPAEVDPDLAVVLGTPDRLPPSLVWELAYSELVFLPMAWREVTADHLGDAIASYAHRHRRFGGVD
jgi:undecaprenyl diphosphate synthase